MRVVSTGTKDAVPRHAACPPPEDGGPLPERHLPAGLWIAVFFLVSALLQLAQPVWFDADTGYHVAVGRLIAQHGMLSDFPWTPFSIMHDRYADTELLFHLLFTATSFLPPDASSKLIGTLLGTLLLSGLYAILRTEKAPHPGYLALLPLAISGAFAVRFATVRPHLLGVMLSIGVLFAAARRRHLLLAVLAVLYPLCYLAWPMALALVILAQCARLLCREPPDLRALLIAPAGLCLSLALHPHFPAIIEHAGVELFGTLVATAWADPLAHPIGGEFRPFSPWGTVAYVLLPALLALASLVVGLARRRSLSPTALTFALAATLFVPMTLLSQRFLEYLVPFAVLAAGLVLATLLRRRKGLVLGAALIASALYTALVGQPLYQRIRHRTDMFPPKTAAILQRLIPGDAQVFTCDWQFTGEMMLALPGRRFLVALDPVLFYRKDKALYRRWLSLVGSPPVAPSVPIRRYFRASYVLCEDRPKFRPFMSALERESPKVQRVDAWPWRVFRIADPG